jgi:hypothetical protein
MHRSVFVAVSRGLMTLGDSLPTVARAAMAMSGFVETSPDPVIPSFQSEGAGARPSARRQRESLIQADRVTSWTGKRSGSGATGRKSQACRAVNKSGPPIPAKRRPPTNESECVAGAKRWSATEHQPKAEPSKRANANSGRGRRRVDMLLALLSHRMVTL